MPPFEMNSVEKYFKQQVESTYADRKVIMGRTANLTEPVKGRGQCQARDRCHRGCPFGAYFSTNASTMPAAYATGNLTVMPHSLVNKILYDDKIQKAAGVEVIDTNTNSVMEYYARIIFVNASTVGTTAILLNSISGRFPHGLGNDSDQLGRNLMDHHKGISAAADVDGFDDMYHYGKRPVSIYIPRFRNITKKDTDFVRGYHFGGNAYRGRKQVDGIGAGLKEAMSEPGGWRMGMYAFGECLPYADNRITLDQNKKDKWGRPLMVVDCEFKDNEKAMNKDMADTAGELLEAAGFKNVQVQNNMSFPGNANHEMGTARMGSNKNTSVLNSFNQMHDVPNVFITDGSCMVSGSCVNPSLTYMALTARACEYAVNEMKKQNL